MDTIDLETLTPEQLLRRRAARWLRANGCTAVAERGLPAGDGYVDLMGWRDGRSVLLRCFSESRALASCFTVASSPNVGNWRFCLTPPELVEAEQLPPGWGLLWAHPRRIESVAGVPASAALWQQGPFVADKDAELELFTAALGRDGLLAQLMRRGS